jgi:hypothetical protein
MPFKTLHEALPALQNSLDDLPALHDSEQVWDMLRRLLVAHAPSGGANLLGGIGDEITVLADALGLRDRVKPYLGTTGNTAIWLGADKPHADLVVMAHMDRPSFRVQDRDAGILFPICANRFPAGEYRIPAKAVRFEKGRLVVGAAGMVASDKGADRELIRFETRRGELAWHDTVLIDVNPARDGDTVVGTGLDNSLGVLTVLLVAAALHGVEDAMRERERRCLIVFTDQEEGPPDGFFGHGAARLAYELDAPTYGCVIVDAHNAGMEHGVQLGQGMSHGLASNWGRGSIVPPNYMALATDLAANLNTAHPGTVQLNTGYLSRSDDMALSRWTRVLGLAGPPMTGAHTGHETAHLSDIQHGVRWLAHFIPAVLNLAPALTPRYALG